MFKKFFKAKPSYNDFFLFFLQMSLYCKSGSTPTDAINALEKQTENAVLKSALKTMHKDLVNGITLAVTFAKQSCFPKSCAEVVRAGEESGELSKCLEEISYDMEQIADVLRRIYSAVLPSLIALAVMFVALIVMVFFVMPHFQKIYNDLNTPLPLPSQIIIQTANIVADFWYICLLAVFLLFFFLKRYFKKNPSAKDSLLLKIPFYKDIHYAFLQYKFLKTFKLLYSSGISSMEAVEYTAAAINNEIMADMLKKTAQSIKGGLPLDQALKKNNTNKILDVTVINLITTGESGGTINEILEEAAIFYKKIIAAKTETFGTKITPFFLVPVFAMIIFIILSVQYPLLMMLQGV